MSDLAGVGEAPRRAVVTVLFCDIRGFTALFDEKDPREALDFANSVLGSLGNVVLECSGIIDKFTGDGFLAYFGIDNSVDHANSACLCAIRLLQHLEILNQNRYVSNLAVVSLGIGLHSGEVAAGVIKTATKNEFTILGSTVNIASRIEGLTKRFSVNCLVSAETAKLVSPNIEFKKMPIVPLRGISKEIQTFWLMPTNRF